MTHVYTRECHENKNTRFWATYDHRENDEPEDGGVMSNDSPLCPLASFRKYISHLNRENEYLFQRPKTRDVCEDEVW